MRYGRLIAFLTFALTMLGGLHAAEALDKTSFDPDKNTVSFDLLPASDAVAGCLADAEGRVTVLLKEEARGVDTLLLTVRGLPANTDFAVFLTSADAFATPPFGATQYIGDFTTNAAGAGKLKVDAIIGEAFITTVVAGTRIPVDLDHLVFWFADPEQARNACNVNANTPFDGDGQAGPAAMSSQGPTGLENF